MRKWITILTVLFNIFAASAQIEWNDSTSTDWNGGIDVDITPGKPDPLPGDWIIATGEDGRWQAKALYAVQGEQLFSSEPEPDIFGNKWTSLDYDDSGWMDILGPLDRDRYDNWPDEYSRYYVRRAFECGDLSKVNSVKLFIAHDDDAVVYLNGTKVADCPDYTDYAYREFVLSKDLLNSGRNVICVNIYQGWGGANLYFGLQASEKVVGIVGVYASPCNSKTTKCIIDRQILIIRNDHYYNASGQQVSFPQP